jgi:phosphocarrier protein FPr
VTPLEKVPDPTFAQKLVGDGVAIDPTDERLVSPCAGRVALLHSSGHALTIATPEGLEVLMHVGLETVTLKGQGFKPLVKEGQEVRPGDPLIDFDADYIVHHAKSLLTIVAIANVERLMDLKSAEGLAIGGQTELLKVAVKGEVGASKEATTRRTLATDPIVILVRSTR